MATRAGAGPGTAGRVPLRVRLHRLLVFVANVTLYPLSGLVPRTSRRWVFGYTGDVFADNPKYLFLWMRLHRSDIDVRWITGSRETRATLRRLGYPVHARWSPGGMIAVLRARVIVFSHGTSNVNAALSRGAFLVNLWHGVGIKTIHLGHKGGNTAAAGRAGTRSWIGRIMGIEYLRPYDVVVTTSDAMQRHFAQQFDLPPERCPQLGYPRLDCAADPALAAAALAIDRTLGFELKPAGYDEVLLYLPTYRDTNRPFFEQAIPDVARLSDALAARRALLYVKPHPRTRFAMEARHDNIRIWPSNIDFNTHLASIDGLITDYSSVLYDYLCHRTTGIILYVFDLAEYLARDRELAMPFDENVTGLRIADFPALCDAIRGGTAVGGHGAAEAADIERLRVRFWGGSRSPASPAIVEHVLAAVRAPVRVEAPGRRRDRAPSK